ncbi:hypothetical protein BH18CHL1_BH18CHL1_06460 [soil metagenome]
MIGQMIKGAIAGAAATWVMDLVTTGMVGGQTESDKKREQAAMPNGQSSIANLVDKVDATLGLGLSDDTKGTAGQAVHYGLGIVPGALYAILRRIPLVGAANGILFGALLFAAHDEYLNSALGLSGPFDAYPMSTHARGLVGHMVLGATTDSLLDLMGG